MRRIVLGCFAAVFVLFSAEAARPALPSPLFSEHRAFSILSEISSDDFAGRESGLPSGARMEDYVADHFRASGLEPAGENGSYFQKFPMLATEERGAEMTLLDSPFGEVPLVYGDDFTLVTNSGSGDVTAEVVVVGHGLSDASRKWDDYRDIDVKGKIVLIVRGAPENGFNWDQENSRDSTLTEAVHRGAAGVLFIQEARPVHGGAVHEGAYFANVPVAYIGSRIGDLLFLNTGLERDAYEKSLSEKSHPFTTGKRLHFVTKVDRIPDASARNVIGRIQGSDASLREEIILIGAHMDHLGKDGRGEIFNGADDNGSGAALVIELARAMASAGEAPRRTILFTTFAGEEQGLLGSEALAKHPPFDLYHVVAMLNFDMVGQGNGKSDLGGGEQYPDILRAFRAALDSTASDSLAVHHAWGGEGSDHAPFRRAGIPTFNLWTEGEHHFYHRIDDDIAWIDSTALGTTGRMAERWVRFLADWPEPLLQEHELGRSLLYQSSQVDFDGTARSPLPPYVAGGIRWFDAGSFGGPEYLSALDAMQGADSVLVAAKLSDVPGALWQGKRACAVGLDPSHGSIPQGRMHLLGALRVAFIRENGTPGDIKALAAEGVSFVVSPDTAWISALPKGAKAYVRIFPGRAGALPDPALFPRDRFRFIVTLEDSMPVSDLAATLKRIGWDRVHLDLVPWIERSGERPVWVYLEELQASGTFEQRHWRAMLGGNLDRL